MINIITHRRYVLLERDGRRSREVERGAAAVAAAAALVLVFTRRCVAEQPQHLVAAEQPRVLLVVVRYGDVAPRVDRLGDGHARERAQRARQRGLSLVLARHRAILVGIEPRARLTVLEEDGFAQPRAQLAVPTGRVSRKRRPNNTRGVYINIYKFLFSLNLKLSRARQEYMTTY